MYAYVGPTRAYSYHYTTAAAAGLSSCHPISTWWRCALAYGPIRYQ